MKYFTLPSFGVIYVKLNLGGKEADFAKFLKHTPLEEAEVLEANGEAQEKYLLENFTPEMHASFSGMINFLLVSRRVSLGLSQLVRGMYDPGKPDKVAYLFHQTYPCEREILQARNYQLMLAYYCDTEIDKIDPRIQAKFIIGRVKYDMLIRNESNYNLEYYLTIQPTYLTQEWGFPKGKSIGKETQLKCALREFEEETGMMRQNITLLNNLSYQTENMTGTDGIVYNHVYYLAVGTSGNASGKTDMLEIGKSKIVSYVDAMEMIRNYHTEKRTILSRVYLFFVLSICRYRRDNNLSD